MGYFAASQKNAQPRPGVIRAGEQLLVLATWAPLPETYWHRSHRLPSRQLDLLLEPFLGAPLPATPARCMTSRCLTQGLTVDQLEPGLARVGDTALFHLSRP